MQTLEDGTDASGRIRAIRSGHEWLAAGRCPGQQDVELQLTQELQALDIGGAVAFAKQSCHPLAIAKVDAVAGDR